MADALSSPQEPIRRSHLIITIVCIALTLFFIYLMVRPAWAWGDNSQTARAVLTNTRDNKQ